MGLKVHLLELQDILQNHVVRCVRIWFFPLMECLYLRGLLLLACCYCVGLVIGCSAFGVMRWADAFVVSAVMVGFSLLAFHCFRSLSVSAACSLSCAVV